MPNWCLNEWTIEASSEAEAKEIFDLITTDDPKNPGERVVTFSKFLPRPAILEKVHTGFNTIDGVKVERWCEEWDENGQRVSRPLTAEELAEVDATGFKDWHAWSLSTWGTKWNPMSGSAEIDYQTIRLEFDTAWGPPQAFYDALEEKFPEAYFEAKYDEPGMRLRGYL